MPIKKSVSYQNEILMCFLYLTCRASWFSFSEVSWLAWHDVCDMFFVFSHNLLLTWYGIEWLLGDDGLHFDDYYVTWFYMNYNELNVDFLQSIVRTAAVHACFGVFFVEMNPKK